MRIVRSSSIRTRPAIWAEIEGPSGNRAIEFTDPHGADPLRTAGCSQFGEKCRQPAGQQHITRQIPQNHAQGSVRDDLGVASEKTLLLQGDDGPQICTPISCSKELGSCILRQAKPAARHFQRINR